MSWSLSAYGHADDPETEKQLAAGLGQVLAGAGEAVSNAEFTGQQVTGDPRDLAGEPGPSGTVR